MSIRTIARRIWFIAEYHLFARPKLRRNDVTRVLGLTLNVPVGVFHPALYFSSATLGTYLLSLPLEGKSVLDMGCGSGILSLVASRRGAVVTSIDVNPDAVRATRENGERNGIRVHTLNGNLFEPLESGSSFDIIVFNPPFYSGKPRDLGEMAWRGGDRHGVLRTFLAQAPSYLRPDASILIIVSSDMPPPPISDLFAENGYSFDCVRTRRLVFEELLIYRAYRDS